MMLIIYIAIAVWLAKGLVEILIGLLQIVYGLTLLAISGLWTLGIMLKKAL
jgi:hypothetical protein